MKFEVTQPEYSQVVPTQEMAGDNDNVVVNVAETHQLSEESMAKLKRNQSALRGQISKVYNKAKREEEFDYDAIQLKFEQLLDIEDKLFPDGPSDKEQEKIDEYSDKMIYLRKVKGLMKGDKKGEVNEPKRIINCALEEVPKFDGTFQEWDLFKELFNVMIGENSNYSMLEKKRYLIQACSGEARQLIAPHTKGEQAYTAMMKALTDHYENFSRVKESILCEIRKLPYIANKLDPKIKDFKDKAFLIVNHVKEFFKKEVDFHDRVVKELINRWQKDFASWFTDKYDTMDDVIRVLQQLHDSRERKIKFGQLSADENKSVAVVFSKPSSSSVEKGCIFCGESHQSWHCKANMSPAERIEIAKSNNHCYNCLRYGHTTLKCMSEGRCNSCGKKHHTLLHNSPVDRNNQFGSTHLNASASVFSPSVTSTNQSSGTSQGTSGAIQAWSEQWQVAGVAVISPSDTEAEEPILRGTYNGDQVRILLDTGSRRTLIKRKHVCNNLFRGQPMIFDGVGGVNPSSEMALFQVVSNQGKAIEFTAYVLDRLPGDLDMIIGSDQLYKVFKPQALGEDKRCFFNTEFGVIKYGGIDSEEKFAGVARVDVQVKKQVLVEPNSKDPKASETTEHESELKQHKEAHHEETSVSQDNSTDDQGASKLHTNPIPLGPEGASVEDDQATVSSFKSSDYKPRTMTPEAPYQDKWTESTASHSLASCVTDPTMMCDESNRPDASRHKNEFYHLKWPDPDGAPRYDVNSQSADGSFCVDPDVYPHCQRGPDPMPSCGPEPPDPPWTQAARSMSRNEFASELRVPTSRA